MIRAAILLIVIFTLLAGGLYGASRLVMWWRDTLRVWRLQKLEERKQIEKEADEAFRQSQDELNELLLPKDKGVFDDIRID